MEIKLDLEDKICVRDGQFCYFIQRFGCGGIRVTPHDIYALHKFNLSGYPFGEYMTLEPHLIPKPKD